MVNSVLYKATELQQVELGNRGSDSEFWLLQASLRGHGARADQEQVVPPEKLRGHGARADLEHGPRIVTTLFSSF